MVLFIITPRVLAILVGGIEACCQGEHAVCGEVIAGVYEFGRPPEPPLPGSTDVVQVPGR